MANQHLVRALVAREDTPRLRRELMDEADIPADHIQLADAEPADYRDESPELELHRIIGKYHRWGLGGALLGAVLALVLVLVIPPLRDWLPFSLILVFGGAWGGGIAAAARTVQVTKPEDDSGEQVHHVSPADAEQLQVLTVTVDRDREAVVELLQERGATLLDATYPKVGRGPDARPANPGQGSHSGDHRD